MDFTLNGVIRRLAFFAAAGGERAIRLTGFESLAVTSVEPLGYELTRSGRRFFGGVQGGATGRAPVGTIPTTAAAWMLWNGERASGKSYAIDQISIVQVSGTAAVGGAILAAITTAVIAAPTAATGYATASANAGTDKSRAVWADNVTLAATPVWKVLKANGNPATTTNGGDTAEVSGRIIIPPGHGLALHYLSGAGTSPLFGATVDWLELEGELD